VAPQLGRGYSTKSRQAGRANEQSMYSLMSMDGHLGEEQWAYEGDCLKPLVATLMSLK
jgi:hypothetical protein